MLDADSWRPKTGLSAPLFWRPNMMMALVRSWPSLMSTARPPRGVPAVAAKVSVEKLQSTSQAFLRSVKLAGIG